MLKVKPYTAADLVKITGDEGVISLANHNQVAGPGFTVFDGNSPVASGGIRILGAGVAWFVMNEEKVKENPIAIVRRAKAKIDEMQRVGELCEVFALSENADKWLSYLGFKKIDNIFVR